MGYGSRALLLFLVRRMSRSKMSEMPRQACTRFVSLEDGEDSTRDIFDDLKLRIVSYNMLAQVYVRSSYFPHSPSSCLKWKARSQAVLTRLKNFDADFLCVQELDEYDSFYKSNMVSHGYSSIYVQRTGQKRDGCGIFYKLDRTELVLDEEIHYNDLVSSIDHGNDLTEIESNSILDSKPNKDMPEEDDVSENNSIQDRGDPSDPCVRLKRDCVGVLAAFKLSDPSHHLVVIANTHIYWDPEWVDVKLAQAKYLIQRLSRFTRIVSDKYNCIPSVVVAGDFNSTPGDEVYQYLVSANTSIDYPDGFPIQLHSLYANNGGEPPFTNCTPGFTGTLDYIFLSDTSSLKPVSLLEVPGPESADVIGGLPNHHHPSDHLPIGADFRILSASSASC